jgi:hypothetical protein
MEKECKKHGFTDFALRKDGRYRCKKCSVENVQARRTKLKIMAVAYKGGKCQNPDCGYDKCVAALDFHHNNGDKSFGLSQGNTTSWATMKKELDKCVMLCANCHREVHAGILELSELSSASHYDVKDKKDKKTCIDCGVEIERVAERCTKCYGLSHRTTERPSQDILLNEIKILGYAATGRKYGVSDNAIRKWVKYYNK